MKRTGKNTAGLMLCALVLLLAAGCAGTVNMTPEDASGIKRLGVATTHTGEGLAVFDHTGINEQQYGGAAYGAIGGAIEGAVKAGYAAAAVKASLGGDPELLEEELRGFDVEAAFDEEFTGSLELDCDVVGPSEVNGLVEYVEGGKGEHARSYRAVGERLGVDAVLEIDYTYGLAAYNGVSSSSVVEADVKVIRLKDDKVLLRKRLSSDDEFRRGHSVNDFSREGARIYREELKEAIKGLSHLVLKEFGVEPDSKKQSRWATGK